MSFQARTSAFTAARRHGRPRETAGVLEAKAIKWDGSTFFVPDKVASGADAALKYHYFTAVLKSTASSSALAETKINFFVSRFNVGP